MQDILEIIAAKPKHVGACSLGARQTEKIIDAADLVTEMVEIKHYYTKGIEPARE